MRNLKKGDMKGMSDLGSDVGQATLNMAGKSMDAVKELIQQLLNLLSKRYNYSERIAKANYDKMVKMNEMDRRSGFVTLAKLRDSGHELTQAKVEMTREQRDKFLEHAKNRGVPVSYISNGTNANGKDVYLAVYRNKDEAVIGDIFDQLVRDYKIKGLEKAMEEQVHFKKKDFESAIQSVDGKITENPVIICERTNPNSYIKVTGTQEEYKDGRPYVASLYEVYNNGVKQKSQEFKHGEFLHNCDGDGKNSSEAGEVHWDNMRAEMKDKGQFSDDILVFKSEKEYGEYLATFSTNREQAEKDSEFYDSIKNEKDKTIKDDVDHYNEKQAQSIFDEISGVAKEESLSFADTVDHFQADGWEKEEPYYICKRTDPDNYIEVQIEQSTDHTGADYNKHTYNIYVDDVQVTNPHREDGKFVDERFEDRPADYWKNMKADMKEAGQFTDDCVVFVDKEDYMKYRQLYQQEHAQIKDPTLNFETDKNGLRNDFGYVQSYLEACKNDIKKFEDLGTYSNGAFNINTKDDGTLDVKSFINSEVRIKEAGVITEQINNYQSMVTTANELFAEKTKLEALEKSDLSNNEIFASMLKEQADKVSEKTNQMKELQAKEEKLWEQREQITGVKSEIQLRREEIHETETIKTQYSEKELKDFANNVRENKSVNTSRDTKVCTRTEKDRG